MKEKQKANSESNKIVDKRSMVEKLAGVTPTGERDTEAFQEKLKSLQERLKTNVDPLKTGYFFKLLRIILRLPMWIFYHSKIIGRKRQRVNKPTVFVGNHLVWQDAVTMMARATRQVHPIGKIELMGNDFSNWFLSHAGMIAITRDTTDMNSLRTILRVLKSGHDIVVFPEGTRNRVDTRFQRILSGSSMFALKSGASLAPFATNRRCKFFNPNYLVCGDIFELVSDGRINTEKLADSDAIIRQRIIECKRVADVLPTLEKRQRKYWIRLLNNPRISFADIYANILPILLPLEQSVISDEEYASGFDPTKKIVK